jgi:hypothetical protein
LIKGSILSSVFLEGYSITLLFQVKTVRTIELPSQCKWMLANPTIGEYGLAKALAE